MNALILMLIPATIGVDFGWERQPDNSIEYILQIEPEAINSMMSGTELISTLPPQLRNIRDYRIRVGRDPLPNKNKIPPDLEAQPNIATNNYPNSGGYGPTNSNYPTNNYTTASNYPQSTPGAYPSGSYPTNNNTTAPTFNPNTSYAGTATGGMTPVNTPTVPTSTSGFPLQTSNATYPTNSTNQTLANLPPPPGSYPNNFTNPYPAGSSTPAGYAPAGYTPATNYGANPYGTNNYAQGNYAAAGYQQPYANLPYPNQPYQPTPNPYAHPQQQYLAMNGAPAFAGYGTAKPSLNDPAGTAGSFPQGTQFTPPGMNAAGLPPLGTNAMPSTNPSTLAPGGLTAGNTPLSSPFVNASATTAVDPHASTTSVPGQAATKESQSQWASLAFALVALFASMGANIYIGWQNHYLRERCRMLVADRAAY